MALNGHTICVLYIISCCFTVSTAENVSITDGATLRQYLCPDTGTLPPNTHLLLSKPLLVLPDVGSSFCLIENTTDLSISPSQDVLSEGHDYVNISCRDTEIGFGFFNVTNLAISSVIFYMCGEYPSSEVVKYVNETSQFLYYDNSVPIVLFFSHCYDIKLHNVSTSFNDDWYDDTTQHTVRLVVGVNLCGDSEVISDGTCKDLEGNMGLFVYFTDTAILTPTLHCDLNITLNCNAWPGSAELELSDRVKVGCFSDLTLFLTQSLLVNVDLNIGSPSHSYPVTVTVVFVNSDTASLVSFQGYEYPYEFCASSNSSDSYTASIQVVFYETSNFTSSATDILHPMWIHDTAFTDCKYCDYVLVVQKLTGKLSHKVSLDNVSWCSIEGNYNALDHAALFVAQNLAKPSLATVGELYMSLNSIFLAHGDSNSVLPWLMYFSHVKQISMTGTNYFKQNPNVKNGGTVIKLVASELAVSGNLTIMGGHAQQGGGIFVDGLSTLAFKEPLVAGFYNNIADQGSAIYSPKEQNDYKIMRYLPIKQYGYQSPLQVRPDKKYSLDNVTSINISLYFWNNSNAFMHRSIHAPHFSFLGHQRSPNLLFDKDTWDSDRSQYAYTTLIDAILHMDRIDKYTSLWNGFCIQPHQQEWECGYIDRLIDQLPCLNTADALGSTVIYPGQKAFSVHYLDANQRLHAVVCTRDLFHFYTYSPVANDDSTLSFNTLYFPEARHYRYVVLFTDFNPYTFFYRPNPVIPVYLFYVSDCPLGFSLNNESCTCDNKLTSHGYSCDIDTETITSPPGYWTGTEEQKDSEAILFDALCHPNYCDNDRRDFHLTDDPAEACLGNRTGVLCGKCKENYSVVFGSDTCYDHCTDVYYLTMLVYVLAGLLLVFLLFALRITVATGAINGLIFYANVLGLVLDQLTEGRVQTNHYTSFIRVFISLLNLDLGFSLCFYEGMTTAGKVGFQFVFPVYLWSIVVMLILLSKCSVRLSELISKSSVQVLVTLFYLSFSKLLSTVIVIFSSSTISVIKGPGNYTSRLVWYYDGHDYGSSTHAILLVLAVAFTVLFLFPYALLVTFSSHLLRFRIVNKFRPFIDAYGGPFKDKWRFWFGLRLWITILLFCLNGALEGTNTKVMFVVIFMTVGTFVFLQNITRPFKNRFIGALDLFFMANYCLLVSSFFWTRGIFWWIYILMTITAVLTTALIVVGHLLALSETCRAKCVNMLPQERNDYQYRELMQDDDEDIDLFAAAEDRVQDTY